MSVMLACGIDGFPDTGWLPDQHHGFYSADGYRFSDFVKVGLPLNLICRILGVIFIPIFWPFGT